MTLTSASVPPVGPGDHVRGPDGAPVVIVYANFTCAHCVAAAPLLRTAPVRLAFRHFALTAKHPRAPALAAAAEAAALQGAFWPMHDALFAAPGDTYDPHLWAQAERLGLDVERFEADRRSDTVAERVRRDVRSAMRAGVVATPTVVVGDALHPWPVDPALLGGPAGDGG